MKEDEGCYEVMREKTNHAVPKKDSTFGPNAVALASMLFALCCWNHI